MQLLLLAVVASLGIVQGVIVLKEASYTRLPNRGGNYVINSGTARESAYDDVRKYLYVIGTQTAMLHVLDLSDPANPKEILTQNFDPAIDGAPLDVELCLGTGNNYGNNKLAITFDGQVSVAFEGHLVLYNLLQNDGDSLTPVNPNDPRVTVGPHPDNMKFTSDCQRLVISNEGEPRVVEGTFYDPEGSVSVINFNADPMTPPSVSTIDFKKYDDDLGPVLASGVRYWLRRDPTDDTKLIQFSQNVEPEYIAISPNNGYAYVTLQENNAIARIDLENSAITNLIPMGYKDWSIFNVDTSDRDNGAGSVSSRNVRSLYQPDKVAFFLWNEIPYLITTDEGKPTNLPQTSFQDYDRGNSISWSLTDQGLQSQLNSNAELGRCYFSTIDGFDTNPNIPYMFGGRGFSIWNTVSNQRTWESGDELERLSRQYFPDTFNGDAASNSQTPVQEADARSTWMGPEASTIVTGQFAGREVVVVGSGRNGLLYVFALQPAATQPAPDFQSVHRAGAIDATWNNLYLREEMGDIFISDIKFSEADSLVIVVSERSGSVSVYTLADEVWPPTSQ